jgi:uncharacterized protein YhfF
MNVDDLPRWEFADPGPVRDQVVAAILDGTKTTTTGLALTYERQGKPYPAVGERFAVVDSDGRPATVIEMAEVRLVPMGEIDLRHVLDDGDESIAEWRAAHEEYFQDAEMRELLGDPEFTVNDKTTVLALRFRLTTAADELRA